MWLHNDADLIERSLGKTSFDSQVQLYGIVTPYEKWGRTIHVYIELGIAGVKGHTICMQTHMYMHTPWKPRLWNSTAGSGRWSGSRSMCGGGATARDRGATVSGYHDNQSQDRLGLSNHCQKWVIAHNQLARSNLALCSFAVNEVQKLIPAGRDLDLSIPVPSKVRSYNDRVIPF